MKDKVLKFFKEICDMPHGSGNCTLAGDYLMRFAEERGLEAIRDRKGNVLIKAPAVKRENEHGSTVILQGHQDMVCVKEDNCTIDMARDPLELIIENGMISAKGTSLGADDGIGEAMALAVLDDKVHSRPAIEAIFTVDEETGMSGAAEFDTSILKGKKLINLDSEEEGVVTCSCAGGERLDVCIPLSKERPGLSSPIRTSGKKTQEQQKIASVKIEVSGLVGGHSGCDIHKGRLSALRVITDILGKVKGISYAIADFCGGKFDNVICSDAYAVLVTEKNISDKLVEELKKIADRERIIYQKTEKLISIDIISSEKEYTAKDMLLGAEETKEFLSAMSVIPQGVTLMMKECQGAVDTSMNLGTVRIDGNYLKMTFSLRSSNDERRKELENKVTDALERIKGCTWNVRDPYPAWQFVSVSPLRDVLCKAYKELFGQEMVTAVTHGGLECGYFASKIEGCEIISIGPQIDDIHSVKEKIAIDSIDRTMKLLTRTLELL
ncbi:MAG: beta-Ala-His dipeptidase [Lachnospiraceae bacterium]|nr:beta-Ala-His dipeptidase [Lachnospiraceae bacterium]